MSNRFNKRKGFSAVERVVIAGFCILFLYLGINRWIVSDLPAVEAILPPHGDVASEPAPEAEKEPVPDGLLVFEEREEDGKIGENVVREHTFKSGDSLFAVLSVLGVPNQEIFDIFKSAKKIYDLRKIIPGQKIKVFIKEAPEAVAGLLYEIDPFRLLKIERSESGFRVVEEKAVLEREIESHTGEISDTLFDSARRAGVSADVVLDLADIFAWDIDFSTEIQAGGRFRVVHEVFKKEGKVVRMGQVLAAEMVNEGETYRAYYFAPPGQKGGYYDEKGHSLKKAFLKSPLRYRYISSGFTTSRRHPILKVSRPHLGIDFAAPQGTPVMAASDGTVTYVGWNGGYGKTVVIQHRNGYSTLYGHLSDYGQGIHKNKKVEQGDIVGRVGSTGLSSGPHLHYTLMKNGKPINPKNSDVVRGDPLSEALKASFSEYVREMDRQMQPVKSPMAEREST